jgi:hypothetical protein
LKFRQALTVTHHELTSIRRIAAFHGERETEVLCAYLGLYLPLIWWVWRFLTFNRLWWCSWSGEGCWAGSSTYPYSQFSLNYSPIKSIHWLLGSRYF